MSLLDFDTILAALTFMADGTLSFTSSMLNGLLCEVVLLAETSWILKVHSNTRHYYDLIRLFLSHTVSHFLTVSHVGIFYSVLSILTASHTSILNSEIFPKIDPIIASG